MYDSNASKTRTDLMHVSVQFETTSTNNFFNYKYSNLT